MAGWQSIGRRTLLGGIGASLISGAARAHELEKRSTIRFGLTPVFLTSDLELLSRLQAYLELATGHPVSLVTRRTYQEITALLLSGQLDAAWICGYPFVTYETQLQLVAVPLWRNRPLYQSYLIVDTERRAADFADLRGDIHAFSDPNSNSGYLVTRCLLAESGLHPETFFRKSFFTYGHRNVIRAVASGLAQSGSVDGYVYEVVAAMEPELAAQTRVLRQSEWLAFPPIAAPSARADPSRISALTLALLRMAEDANGQAVLRMLRLDGFVSGKPELYDPIAAKAALVSQAG